MSKSKFIPTIAAFVFGLVLGLTGIADAQKGGGPSKLSDLGCKEGEVPRMKDGAWGCMAFMPPGFVKTEHIAPDAVTRDKIAPEAIGGDEIGKDAVTRDKIAMGAIGGQVVTHVTMQIHE